MELLISLFPTTASGWAIQIIGSAIAAYPIMSFTEYFFHRYLMHQGAARILYTLVPPLERLLHPHRVIHHGNFHEQFDHAADPKTEEVNLTFKPHHTALAVVFLLPYCILTAVYISLIPTLVLGVGALIHNALWNIIHPAMHRSARPFWTRTRAYKALARHHYIHHHYGNSNFNIIFPLVDYIVGTKQQPLPEDIPELKRLGFID